MDILKKLNDAVVRHRMLENCERVLAAVSGGADSMVMLRLLNGIKDRLGLTIGVCHLNHNLRGKESDRDFNFVKKTAVSLGLAFYGKKLGKAELKGLKGVSLQASARAKRYLFFEQTAKKFKADKVALGHTMSDQAETVLMHLIKGSGLAGLSGMPCVRGKFIRPLIEIAREEVEDYAAEEKVNFVTDCSNLSAGYLRNDIRLNLIPFIKKRFNPGITETLARTAAVLALDNAFIEAEAVKAFSEALVESCGNKAVLDREKLIKFHPAVQSAVFIKVLGNLADKSSNYSVHISSLIKLLKGRRPNASIDLPGGFQAVREYGRLIIEKAVKASNGAPLVDLPLKISGLTAIKPCNAEVSATVVKAIPARRLMLKNTSAAYFDYSLVSGPVSVRFQRPGDRIIPFGMTGSKKLKEVFIEKKVPASKRRLVPLVCDSSGNIIWVVGVLRSNLYKAGRGSSRVIRLEVKRAG